MSSSLKAFNLLGLLIFTCLLDGIRGGFNCTGSKSYSNVHAYVYEHTFLSAASSQSMPLKNAHSFSSLALIEVTKQHKGKHRYMYVPDKLYVSQYSYSRIYLSQNS